METRFSRTTLAVSTLVYPDCALTMVKVATPAATRTAPEIINIFLSFMGRTVSSALMYIIRARASWSSGLTRSSSLLGDQTKSRGAEFAGIWATQDHVLGKF